MIKRASGFVVGLLVAVSSVADVESLDWPQELAGENDAVVLIYQPQVEAFSGNSIEARAAVSVKSTATALMYLLKRSA